MRVCLLTPEFLPTWGGIGTYVYNLARGLRDRAEVHVLAGAAPPRSDDGDLDGIEIHAANPRRPSPDGASPFRFQASVFRRLPRLARTHGFDIVHANHAYMSDLLVRMRRGSAAKVVTVHTTLETQVGGTLQAGSRTPRQSVEGTLTRWRFFLQAVERHYLRKTPTMIFVSRWVRDRTVRCYGVAPRVSAIVPNAIDLDRFSAAPARDLARSDRPTLLFAGRLLALKGIETLLRAMTRLDPRVRLVLAGPGNQGPWRALARGLGLSDDRCEFVGRVPYAAMPDLYRQADALVLPSFTESYPMVALEAMASGTPLIAANAGGLAEIVRDGETGWLFPPGDVDALVARIYGVLSDPSGARRVSTHARSWVEEHGSIDRMAAGTYRVYERALTGAAS